ncbi:MAG: ATP-binding protein [Anaerolineae bacterium]|nr:ATP-binding protein [Anaerolineae bacterium]
MNWSAPRSPQAESASYTLTLVNQLAELVKLAKWLEGLAGQLGLSGEDAFKLELILSEAVTNVIQHGYADADHGDIEIRVQDQGNRLRVEVRDKAKPFNPLEQAEVVFPRTLDEASEGGLGIHLVRTYTEACFYQRIDHQNVLVMVLAVSRGEPDKDRM